MFNSALANHVGGQVRAVQEAHSFLLSRANVDKVGMQFYENTSEQRPQVAWPQICSDERNVMALQGGYGDSAMHHAGSNFMPGAFVANDSMLSLERPTMSTANKTKIARDHLAMTRSAADHSRGSSAHNQSRLHTSTISASAHRLHKTAAQPALDRTLHSVDGSCCNYNHPVQHAKVEGLFVTFCENNVETKLFNAVRDLEIERSNREMDAKMHRQQLSVYLRQIEDLTRANEGLKDQLKQSSTTHSEEASDLRILKEQYELKYREKLSEWEELSRRCEQMSTGFQELQATAGARQNRVDELEADLRAARTTQTLCDKQLKEMQERMAAAIAQASLSNDVRQKADTECKELKLLLGAKEQIICGLQRALQEAEEKMNGIAFLKDEMKHANRKK